MRRSCARGNLTPTSRQRDADADPAQTGGDSGEAFAVHTPQDNTPHAEDEMSKLARDVMTPDPACCSPSTTLDQIAKMMIKNNCGEIPIVDIFSHPIGVVTDRDIVCRVVAEGKNPSGHTAESCMSTPVFTVPADSTIEDVVATMEEHQIRRVPVVDDGGCCTGIIAQADIVAAAPPRTAAELVCEISRHTGRRSL